MTPDYKELLKTAYELEGLLLVQIDRGSEHSDNIDRLIAEKAAALHEEMRRCSCASAPAPVPVPAPAPAEVEAEEIAESAIEEEEGLAAAPAVEEVPPVPETAAETAEDETEEALTLDERLARERAKDIFKAFTLNDKFRFRRELFGNSQAEFDDTLQVISAMSSLDEAEEYFYEDLCWDADNEDVKAFMEILAKHF